MPNRNNGFSYYKRDNRSKRRRNRRIAVLAVFFAVITVLAVLVYNIALRLIDAVGDGMEDTGAAGEVDETGGTDTVGTGLDGAVTTAPGGTGLEYEIITRPRGDVYRGSLILVNRDFEYVFPDGGDFKIKTVFGNKNTFYKVSKTTVSLASDALDSLNEMTADFNAATGKNDLLIVSGFRGFDEQKDVYDAKVAADGAALAALYVAVPGFSEHHTALAIDLSVYTDEGITYSIDSDPVYGWIYENFHKYGWVLRYPDDKINLTGIGFEPWHFRRVGIPHAYAMYTQGFCLEEYIPFLWDYSYDSPLLLTDDEDGEYMIYSVSCPGESVDFRVPKDYPYEISGDNVSGLIITVKLS